MSYFNPNIHHRRSIRLKGYDYSQEGLYFITLCVQNRKSFFGKIVTSLELSEAGKMVETEWLALTVRFPNIRLLEYCVMPNHFHGILEIVGATLGATTRVAPTVAQSVAPKNKTVGDMMDAFKSITTVEYIRGVKNSGWQRFDGKLWQRDYYEHIIRNDEQYERIANYIINNPANWLQDKLNHLNPESKP